MALEYRLRIATSLEPSQVLRSLSLLHSLETRSGQLSGPGVIAIQVSPVSERGSSVIRDAFGFSPTVDITFRLEKLENLDAGVRTVIRATLELLRETAGEVVMLFNGEDVVLLRKDGLLVLNNAWDFWSQARLAQVTLPYAMRSIPSL
jgi:hypothetical protein